MVMKQYLSLKYDYRFLEEATLGCSAKKPVGPESTCDEVLLKKSFRPAAYNYA